MRDEANSPTRDALAGSASADIQPSRKAWQTPVVIVGTVSEDSEGGGNTGTDNHTNS